MTSNDWRKVSVLHRDLYKSYENGAGHIDQRGDRYLVSFYACVGTRVTQGFVDTLQAARFTLRHIALQHAQENS